MAEIISLLHRLAADPAVDAAGPQPEPRVALAEARLGVSFPSAYRHFLLELGTAIIGSEEIYGVVSPGLGEPGVPDVVWITLHDRDEFRLPNEALVIGFDGSERCYVLDTRRHDSEGRTPVVLWEPGESLDAATIYAASFEDFLEDLVAKKSSGPSDAD